MTQHIKTSVVAPKMNEVVCAYNFFNARGGEADFAIDYTLFTIDVSQTISLIPSNFRDTIL
jgi:hypothetical protein